MYAEISIAKLINSFLNPDVVVMGNHDSLRHSSGSRSVYKSAAMPRTYFIHALLYEDRINSFSLRDKFLICHYFSSKSFIFESIISVKNNIVDFIPFQKSKILSSVFSVFSEDQLSLTVLGDVLTCRSIICRVNADGDAAGENSAIEGKTPLWRVEANDVDGSKFFKFESDQRLGKLKAFIIILAEVY